MAPDPTRVVEGVMIDDPVAVTPDTALSEFLAIAVREGISGAPVIDEADRVVGIVSLHDVVREIGPDVERALEEPPSGVRASEGRAGAGEPRGRLGDRPGGAAGSPDVPRTVAHVMTASVFSVRPETSLAEAARCLADAQIHRAPVVRDGRLAGLVTTFDLLRALSGETES